MNRLVVSSADRDMLIAATVGAIPTATKTTATKAAAGPVGRQPPIDAACETTLLTDGSHYSPDHPIR
jgi:hypothetical protein